MNCLQAHKICFDYADIFKKRSCLYRPISDLFSKGIQSKKTVKDAMILFFAHSILWNEFSKGELQQMETLLSFGAYLVQRCFLVAVSTPTRQAAFRIFSVMNSRGMSLLATDIIKADIIGAIRESWHDEYNNKWEEMEVEVAEMALMTSSDISA